MTAVTKTQGPSTTPLVVVAALFLAAVASVVLVITAHTKPADPWADTKGLVAIMCHAGPVTYVGPVEGLPAGVPEKVQFSAPGHPAIYVPYSPSGGFEHPAPGDIEC